MPSESEEIGKRFRKYLELKRKVFKFHGPEKQPGFVGDGPKKLAYDELKAHPYLEPYLRLFTISYLTKEGKSLYMYQFFDKDGLEIFDKIGWKGKAEALTREPSCFFEVCRGPVKLVFDAEYKHDAIILYVPNSFVTVEERETITLTYLCKFLKQEFGKPFLPDDFVILDSSNETKSSRHYIHGDLVFESIQMLIKQWPLSF